MEISLLSLALVQILRVHGYLGVKALTLISVNDNICLTVSKSLSWEERETGRVNLTAVRQAGSGLSQLRVYKTFKIVKDNRDTHSKDSKNGS